MNGSAARRLALVCFTVVAVLAVSAARPGAALDDAPARETSITLRDGLLSVDAEGAEWSDVLAALTETTGIPVHVDGHLAGTVTVSFMDLPLDLALRRLFGMEAGLVFRYHDASPTRGIPPVPFEVRVFGGESADPGGGVADTAMSQEGEASPEVILEPGTEEAG